MRTRGGHHISRQIPLQAVALVAFILFIALGCPDLQAAASPPHSPDPVPPDSEFVVMLELDGDPLAESVIVTERDGRLYVPVCALAEALSLAISCLDRRVFGFVLDESRPFLIDLDEGHAISGRDVFPVKAQAFQQNGDVLVEAGELSRLLPIDLSLKAESSTLKIHARELLPLQGFKKRQRFHSARSAAAPKRCADFTQCPPSIWHPNCS